MKHIVSTIAALRAESVSGRPNGSAMHVTGYYAAGDKEAVVYVYSSGSSATDNGGSVIAPNTGSGRWLLTKDVTSVKDFGAKGDDSTDDLAAIQAAFDNRAGDIYFPPGSYKTSEPIVVGSAFNGARIYGAGLSQTVIKPIDCDGFVLTTGDYYRTSFSSFRIVGTSYTAHAAFVTDPVDPAHVVAGTIWQRLSIDGFKHGWRMKSVQICSFIDIDIAINDADAAVFAAWPDSDTGQQCNSNRVHLVRMTGVGTAIDCVLPTVTERATQWAFDQCDIQFMGAQVPIHVVDIGWSITRCEFENSIADCLIHLEAIGESLSPDDCSIVSNALYGGNSKIRVSRADGAVQTPYRGYIVNNMTGVGDFLDLEAGNEFFVGPHNGTVNNTGGRFLVQVGGRNNMGRIRLANRDGITDDVGSTVTEMEAERVILASLPTTDPGVLGQVWSQDGALMVSAGPP